MENLREGFVELRETIEISLGKAIAILGRKLLCQPHNDLSSIFGPAFSFEDFFTDTLSQEPVALHERHINCRVGILPGAVYDSAGVGKEFSAASVGNSGNDLFFVHGIHYDHSSFLCVSNFII